MAAKHGGTKKNPKKLLKRKINGSQRKHTKKRNAANAK
jgi:hypothetical protein